MYSKVIQLHISMYLFFLILFPCSLLQSIEPSSLYYTVGPCWLSILNIAVCICESQTPNLSIYISRDKEGHYIIIKGSIQEEDIAVINTCAPNIQTVKYIRQRLTVIKGELNSNNINGMLTPHLHQWTPYPGRKSIRKHKLKWQFILITHTKYV